MKLGFTAWIIFGVVIGMSLYPIVVEAVEYYGKFPPTAAYSSITLNDTVQVIGETIEAERYNRNLKIGTDGSILINITQGFP